MRKGKKSGEKEGELDYRGWEERLGGGKRRREEMRGETSRDKKDIMKGKKSRGEKTRLEKLGGETRRR